MVAHDFSHEYIIVVYQYFDLRPKMSKMFTWVKA